MALLVLTVSAGTPPVANVPTSTAMAPRSKNLSRTTRNSGNCSLQDLGTLRRLFMAKPLATYLRMFRLRTGFSQDEIAFLLGSMSGANVAKHEKGSRLPMLRNALAYELVLGASIQSLYEGVLVQVSAEVSARARGLHKSIERKTKTPRSVRKIETLKRLIADAEAIAA